MPDLSAPLAACRPALRRVRDRGAVLLLEGDLGASTDAIEAAAEEEGLAFRAVRADVWGLLPQGVIRAGLPGYLGPGAPADPGFCADAVGDGHGATDAWGRLLDRWSGLEPGDASALPPDDEPWRAEAEVLARVLAAIGDVEPTLLLVRDAGSIDDGSLRALQALLAGREAAGWAIAFELTGEAPAAIGALAEVIARIDPDAVARATLPEADEADAPGLPKRGSAVELLDVLGASPAPLPVQVVGSKALAAYRGQPPRAGWLDLQGLLDSGRATLEGALLRLDGWTPTTGEGGTVAAADCRAIREAVQEVLADDDPLRSVLAASLALAGHASDANELAVEAARGLLARGDASAALTWLGRARPGTPGIAALKARAHRWSGDAASARQVALEALKAEPDGDDAPLLHLETALASIELDRRTPAERHLEQSSEKAGRVEDLFVLAAARLFQGRLLEEDGRFGPAAKLLGEAAQACERLGASREAGRAFAARAVCMGKAGAGPRAMKELGLARERAADSDDPHPAVADVRILMGVVFRDAGSRDSARKALALAAKMACEHADPIREAEARLMLARFFLEAIPVKGKERGEALRDGREAAEAVIRLARGLGRADLEAEGESLLGELSYRAEDWASALASLQRQEVLWRSIGRATREVDTAIRRSRLAGRQDDAKQAFSAANDALMLATRRRLPEQSAQAQLARSEALEALDRGQEALAAGAEAQRIFSGLGEAFAGHAAAAEQRARQLVSKGG